MANEIKFPNDLERIEKLDNQDAFLVSRIDGTYGYMLLSEAKEFKGEPGAPFTYANFTPEQLLAIQKPAQDAADAVNEVIQTASTATTNANTATEAAEVATAAANTATETANTAAATAQAAADTIDERLEGVTTSSPIIIDLDSLMGAIDDTMSDEMWRIVQEVQKDRNRSIIVHSGASTDPTVITSCAVILGAQDVTLCISMLMTMPENLTESGLPETQYTSCSFWGKYDGNHVYDIGRGVDSGNLNKHNTVGIDHSILTEQIVPDEFWPGDQYGLTYIPSQAYTQTVLTSFYDSPSDIPGYWGIDVASGIKSAVIDKAFIVGPWAVNNPFLVLGTEHPFIIDITNEGVLRILYNETLSSWGGMVAIVVKYTKR